MAEILIFIIEEWCIWGVAPKFLDYSPNFKEFVLLEICRLRHLTMNQLSSWGINSAYERAKNYMSRRWNWKQLCDSPPIGSILNTHSLLRLDTQNLTRDITLCCAHTMFVHNSLGKVYWWSTSLSILLVCLLNSINYLTCWHSLIPNTSRDMSLTWI